MTRAADNTQSGLSPESGKTLADRVFSALQDEIVMGQIAPGSKLGEAELAARFGVSRGPLREAIRRLESRQLLERIPHVGCRVTQLSLDDLIEVYQVRELLEGEAVRLAASAMSDEEIVGLREVLAQHEQQRDLQAGEAYFQHEGDLDFHYRIIQGSHNKTLINLLLGELYYRVRMYRYRASRVSQRPQRALHEHHAIMEAIEQRDGEMAALLMRRHLARARSNLEQQKQAGGDTAFAFTPSTKETP